MDGHCIKHALRVAESATLGSLVCKQHNTQLLLGAPLCNSQGTHDKEHLQRACLKAHRKVSRRSSQPRHSTVAKTGAE